MKRQPGKKISATTVFSVFVLLLLFWTPAESISCHPGHHVAHDLNGHQKCLPCPNNTFISYNNHQFVDCQRCSEPDKYQQEVALKPCTAVSDSIIGCRKGYFYKIDHRNVMMVNVGECERCSVCDHDPNSIYEVQPCTQFLDTVCCPQPDMLVEQEENGKLRCVEYGILTQPLVWAQTEPIVCRRGQYLHQHQNEQQRCLPCPKNTFISHDHHQFVDCQRCSEPNEYQHEITLKPCTAVSNSIIGCSQGYFRQNRDHHDMVAIGDCEKCSDCEYNNLYEVQPCTQFADTVCCPQPDLMAILKQHTKMACRF